MRSSVRVSLLLTLLMMLSANGAAASDANLTGLDGLPGSQDEILRSLQRLCQRVETTDQPATLTLQQLREGNLAWRKEISSVKVHFQNHFQRIAKATEGAEEPNDLTMDVTFAIQGERRFLRAFDLAQPTLTPFTAVFGGTNSKIYFPPGSLGQVSGGKVPKTENLAVSYFNSLNWYISNESLRETEFYIPFALNMPEYYRVLPTLEKVDGALCHVIVSDFDAIWLDPAQGFAMKRRVQFSRISADDNAACLAYIQCPGDFVEVESGVWFPHKFNTLFYTATDVAPEKRGQLTHTYDMKVLELSVNDVADSEFDYEFPAGALVTDFVIGRRYYMPGGVDRLDEAIALSMPITTTKLPGQVPPPVLSDMRFLVLVANVILVLVLLAVVGFRRFRAHHAAR